MKIEEDFVFPVYISDKILQEIKKICSSYKVEVFGYLIGEIFSWKNKKYLLIEHQFYSKKTFKSNASLVAQIEGASGEFNQALEKLKKKSNKDSLRKVGWWHSHPNFGVFLSPTDVKTHRYFFPEPIFVALVVDPIRDEHEFFSIDDKSKKGYKVISSAILNE
ncbi:MAG: Mov34/MPN/PAD-1 family protein [Candidatus Lokiarchaeota archaeon]|nr:Mov34/MPN/PAD-1 family protein [Candidatus Lokiarchaeota archaeon]